MEEVDQRMQFHSSLVRRLSQEQELEGHQGCVNALAWNSNGSLLISGSDDLRINIWNYSSRKLLHSIDTGHTANIFCTKFVPETSDELVVSGAGDAEVYKTTPFGFCIHLALHGIQVTFTFLLRCVHIFFLSCRLGYSIHPG